MVCGIDVLIDIGHVNVELLITVAEAAGIVVSTVVETILRTSAPGIDYFPVMTHICLNGR